jgi:acyl-CoA thioester hydrolase
MHHHEATLRVRYAETDQMGVVYYANYLIWMEVGRVEFCRAQGIRYRDMEEADGILLVVAEANCRYLAPARYDDEIRIVTTLAQSTPRLIRFDYELFNLSGTQLAHGFTKHIFCGRDFRPTKLPSKYHKAFKMGTPFPVPALSPAR